MALSPSLRNTLNDHTLERHLHLLLKLSFHKILTMENNIDSAAGLNWKHPLGKKTPCLSYDLLVSPAWECSISDMHPSAL